MTVALQEAQSEWYWSAATEMLVGGAAGPGKSFFLRVALCSWAFEIPDLQIYLFRKTYKDLEQNHINHPMGFPVLLGEHIQAKKVRYNSAKNVFVFDNGSMIHLCHCQHEKDKYNYQGAEIHVLAIDELTHFSESIYTYLRARVRMSGVQIPEKYKIPDKLDNRGYRTVFPRAVLSTNPGGLGHNWVKQTFVDYSPPKTIVKTEKKDGGLYRAFYPAKLSDNQKLLDDDPEYADRLSGLGNRELVRAMLEGDWDIVAGGAIDDVWDRSVHVIKPFKIPQDWYIDRGYDWGSSKPAACIYFAESNGNTVALSDGTRIHFPRGSIIVIREIYFWSGKVNEGQKLLATEHADIIKRTDEEIKQFHGANVRPGAADNAIFDSENGSCIADDMEKRGVRWTKSDKSPGSRKQGLEKLRELLKNALQNRSELPGIYFFDTCTHCIRTLPTLPRDEKKPDDIDTAAEDHLYDVIRYRIVNKKNVATVTRGSHT
jgi:hypothetical protein